MGQCVEDISEQIDEVDDFSLWMKIGEVLNEEIFPELRQIKFLNFKEICSEPFEDNHFSLFSFEKKVKNLELIFQVVKNDFKLYLPFADHTAFMNCPISKKDVLVNFLYRGFVFMAQWVWRHKRLQNPHVQVIHKAYSFNFQVHHKHIVDHTKVWN